MCSFRRWTSSSIILVSMASIFRSSKCPAFHAREELRNACKKKNLRYFGPVLTTIEIFERILFELSNGKCRNIQCRLTIAPTLTDLRRSNTIRVFRQLDNKFCKLGSYMENPHTAMGHVQFQVSLPEFRSCKSNKTSSFSSPTSVFSLSV